MPGENEGATQEATPNKQAESGETMDAQQYVDAVKNMKENMVPKEQYDKVVKENKILTAAVIDGKDLPEGFEKAGSQGKGRPTSELRKDLFSGKEMTNLEYVTAALDLRDRIIEEEGPEADPFAGGKRHMPASSPIDEQRDRETAEAVAERLRECVDMADGDPQAFNAYMSAMLIDDHSQRPAAMKKPRR